MEQSDTLWDHSIIPKTQSTIYVRIQILLGLLLINLLLLLLVYFHDDILALSFGFLCVGSLLVATICIFISARISSFGAWSPATAYLMMLSLFHFGLTGVYGFGLLSEETENHVHSWFSQESTKAAVILATIGVVSCLVGILVAHLCHYTKSFQGPRSKKLVDSEIDYSIGVIGVILVIGSVLFWFYKVVTAGGWNLLIGSYGRYLSVVSTTSMAYVWMGLGFGLSFIAATSDGTGVYRSSRQISLWIFGLFAVFGLLLGLRGEVMFPLLTFAIIQTRKGKRIGWKPTLIGIVATLILISLVQDLRQVGLESAESSDVSGNVLDAVTELGGTLRTVGVVVTWSEEGDAPIRGASYWAPFDRAFCALIPGRTCTAANMDYRLLNVLVQDRIGPIGFSPIAEGVRNFGLMGAVIAPGVLGLIVGLLSRAPVTPLWNSIVGIIMVELFIYVRNSFTAIPAHLIIGFILIGTAVVFSRGVSTLDHGGQHLLVQRTEIL